MQQHESPAYARAAAWHIADQHYLSGVEFGDTLAESFVDAVSLGM
jgi:hypothetical protein